MKLIKVLLLMALVSSCNSKSSGYLEGDIENFENSFRKSSEVSIAQPVIMASSNQVQQANIDRQIIKTAGINFQVEDLKRTEEGIRQTLPLYQAYIANSDQTNYRGRTEVKMIIRIPSDHLDAMLEYLESQALYLHHKELSSKDVTEEFVDVQSRLANKKAAERRFQDILNDAKNVEEILTVEDHLRKIREEIESAEGRLNYLRNQSVYSTLNLTFYQPQYLPAKAPDQGFLRRLAVAFSEGWDILLQLILGMVAVWPIWLLIVSGVVAFRLYRGFQRRQKAI